MSVGEGLQSRLASAQFAALLAAGVGLAGSAAVAMITPNHLFPAYLTAFLFWAGLSLGCLALVVLHNLVGGNWGLPIRRTLELGATNILPMAILFLPILVFREFIYPWADEKIVEHNHLIHYKVETLGYLTGTGFALRSAFGFVVWILISQLVLRTAMKNEGLPNASRSRAVEKYSGILMVIVFFTATFGAIDWNMTREPTWYSSLYGPMVLVGWGLEAFAFAIIVAVLLAKHDTSVARVATVDRMQDLASLLFAFTILWEYMTFSQFLITWMGNLAEEAPFYLRRINGGWKLVVILLAVFHFAVPFFALLFRPIKRNPKTLMVVAALLLGMHLLDLIWLTIPANAQFKFFVPPKSYEGPLDTYYALQATDILLVLLAFAGIGGAWVWTFLWQLRDKPLLSGDALAANGYGAH